jgi:hypothetical protein
VHAHISSDACAEPLDWPRPFARAADGTIATTDCLGVVVVNPRGAVVRRQAFPLDAVAALAFADDRTLWIATHGGAIASLTRR